MSIDCIQFIRYLPRIVAIIGLSLIDYNMDSIGYPKPSYAFTFDNNKFTCEDVSLESFQVIGKGGGGTVFRTQLMSEIDKDRKIALLKISSFRSRDSIQNECNILKYLSSNNAQGVEK